MLEHPMSRSSTLDYCFRYNKVKNIFEFSKDANEWIAVEIGAYRNCEFLRVVESKTTSSFIDAVSDMIANPDHTYIDDTGEIWRFDTETNTFVSKVAPHHRIYHYHFREFVLNKPFQTTALVQSNSVHYRMVVVDVPEDLPNWFNGIC